MAIFNSSNGVAASDSGSSSNGENYSTTETVIGTWTDGKPLYQIVASRNALAVNNETFSVFGPTTNNIKLITAFVQDNYGTNFPVPMVYENGTSTSTLYWINDSNRYNYKGTGRFIASNATLVMIIKYTKTTD